MRDLIQNLPGNTLATATTWLTIKDTLESEEARGAMNIRLRQDLLVEFEKAEMAYKRKYGMRPTLTPDESKDLINDRIMSIVEGFSIKELAATDDVHPSEHASKYKLKRFIDNDLEPEHLIDDGTIMDHQDLLHCYDTLKTVCEDPTLNSTFFSRWKEDSQRVVQVFEDEYFPIMDHVKALELHLASLRKVPAPDELSYESDHDKSKSKSKEFLNKAGNVLRKIPTPKKISDNLFKNFASKKIGEKLKKLEEESEAIEEAETEVEDSFDAGIVRGLLSSASPGYPEVILEEDESDGSSSDDSSDESSDEVSEVDRAKKLEFQAVRAKVMDVYAGTTLQPIKTPITGLFEDLCAGKSSERVASLINAGLKGYDKTLDPGM
jgi:hypothetical protein